MNNNNFKKKLYGKVMIDKATIEEVKNRLVKTYNPIAIYLKKNLIVFQIMLQRLDIK